MAITEVFPNPTVKQVVFEIKFPNLFYIENKIGDFQVSILEKFPESAVAYRRLIFGDIGPDAKLEDIPVSEKGNKIWQFITAGKDVRLSITNNSLDMVSTSHKTYNLEGGNKFRELIEFVLTKFYGLVSIPLVNRIGLRYIDECPLPAKETSVLMSYYNSAFPTRRFSFEATVDMIFKVVVDKGDHFLSYVESLKAVDKSYAIILDFDGYAKNVDSKNCLPMLDKLHESISQEFENTVKEPVYAYMRQRNEVTK